MTVYEEQTTRIEEDALGEKEIPSEAYYGVQTVRAAENFSITGYAIEKELINSLAMVKKHLLLQIWRRTCYRDQLGM